MDIESPVEALINTVERFRILCVGRSGVGKSSLINRVFGIKNANVSEFEPGKAEIEQEYRSEENTFFVLHDSKGFEPGDDSTFNTVQQFVLKRREEKDLKDRLHAIWLCTETPRAGGRVFETGDEKLLKLAYQSQIPVVIVFTQYDRLVRTKEASLKKEEKNIDPETLKRRSKEQATEAFKSCVHSLERIMKGLNTPLPDTVYVSDRKGYEDSIAYLVKATRDVVQERIKGDAWLIWAIAQRASLSVKIDACINKGVSYYHLALAGSTPGVGKMLLWKCLARVHEDIITCWNFKNGDNILNSDEFKELMFYLVQDLHDSSRSTTNPPDIDRISQFVTLVTAASATVAPPAAILGLSFFFVKWLSDAIVERIPEVERLIMAYTVDLIFVLKELFNFTLKPDVAGATSWEVLKEAFEAYDRSIDHQQIHNFCRSAFQPRDQILDRDTFGRKIRELLDEH